MHDEANAPRTPANERRVELPGSADRADLGAYLRRLQRLDDSAVVRMRNRGDGRLAVWASTGFDVLTVRVVDGLVWPNDTVADVGELLGRLKATETSVDPGFSLDSAWRGAVPPETGFEHIDDVPARVLIDLAQRGAEVAKEHGSSQGPPVSLLDQEVLTVEGGGQRIGVRMRVVFALTAMGFVPRAGDVSTGTADVSAIDKDELVRVRATPTWVRLDARFGSVFLQRQRLSLLVGSH